MTISSQNRLILSGTPMQNNLQELWSLFHFVQPGLLGELDYFENQFCKTIIKGGYTNATDVEKETSRQCLNELRDIIQGHILRRTKKQLQVECNLPDRNEYIVFCNLTLTQHKMYEKYLTMAREVMGRDFNRPEALGVLTNLRKIANHPFMFFAFMDGPKKERNNAFRQDLFKLRCQSEYDLYKKEKNEVDDLDAREAEAQAAAKQWK
jgi:DNA excision repair protein ERCC-6